MYVVSNFLQSKLCECISMYHNYNKLFAVTHSEASKFYTPGGRITPGQFHLPQQVSGSARTGGEVWDHRLQCEGSGGWETSHTSHCVRLPLCKYIEYNCVLHVCSGTRTPTSIDTSVNNPLKSDTSLMRTCSTL